MHLTENEIAQSREIVQPISFSNEGETKTVLSLKKPQLLRPVHNLKSKYKNQIHSVDAARPTPQKASDTSGMCGGLSSAHPG